MTKGATPDASIMIIIISTFIATEALSILFIIYINFIVCMYALIMVQQFGICHTRCLVLVHPTYGCKAK